MEQVSGPYLHTPSVEDMQEKMLAKEVVQQVGVYGEGTSKENDSEEVPWEHYYHHHHYYSLQRWWV